MEPFDTPDFEEADVTRSRATLSSAPAGVDDLGSSFEQRLIEAIGPIRGHYLGFALYHLFETGIYEQLACRSDEVEIESLADRLSMDERRLRGFLLYLANEGVVEANHHQVRLTDKGRGYGDFQPWYTLLIGGYATTVAQMGKALARGAASCTRDGRYVSRGSCEISRFDGIPMTRHLLEQAGATCREVIDLGCGNGIYLVEFCKHLPDVKAWGVEPDPGGYEEALKLIGTAGLTDRVRLENQSALEFLANPPRACSPDLIVFGYVLHEILEQEGESAIIALLTRVVARFPRINVVVIEVSNEIDNPGVMRHGLATNLWNPYFLLHYFTAQRLEKRAYWDDLFCRAGLEIAGFTSTHPSVDSTGLELGYLLRRSSGRGRERSRP